MSLYFMVFTLNVLTIFVCIVTENAHLSLTVMFRGSQTGHSDLLHLYWRADHEENNLSAGVSSWKIVPRVFLEKSL